MYIRQGLLGALCAGLRDESRGEVNVLVRRVKGMLLESPLCVLICICGQSMVTSEDCVVCWAKRIVMHTLPPLQNSA